MEPTPTLAKITDRPFCIPYLTRHSGLSSKEDDDPAVSMPLKRELGVTASDANGKTIVSIGERLGGIELVELTRSLSKEFQS